MIGFLQGEVIQRTASVLTVLSGDVGYEVHVTEAVAEQHGAGTAVRLWVHSAIREQGWDLYGFLGRDERDLFRTVQRVPQIGAKTALAMFAVFSAPALIRVVRDADIDALTTVPGIGKKTAERVIVELRDIMAAMEIGETAEAGPGTGDAVRGLVALGFSQREARQGISTAIESGIEPDDIESLIRNVLLQDGGGQ